LDSLQLAVALRLKELEIVFVCADRSYSGISVKYGTL
jgi:hypothetical protein